MCMPAYLDNVCASILLQISIPISESRAATAAQKDPNFTVKTPEGPVELPDFSRRSTFTYTSARQQA
jgi:hypothetical protein